MCHSVHEVYSFSIYGLGCAIMYLLISFEMTNVKEYWLFVSRYYYFFTTV